MMQNSWHKDPSARPSFEVSQLPLSSVLQIFPSSLPCPSSLPFASFLFPYPPSTKTKKQLIPMLENSIMEVTIEEPNSRKFWERNGWDEEASWKQFADSLRFFFYYFILFYFILFYFILFYFILFYFILFYFILFYFILFYFILFYLFYSTFFFLSSSLELGEVAPDSIEWKYLSLFSLFLSFLFTFF